MKLKKNTFVIIAGIVLLSAVLTISQLQAIKKKFFQQSFLPGPSEKEGLIKYFEKRSDNAMRITNCYPKSCQNPVFSPNGEKIMFTRFLNGYNEGPSELVIIDVITGEEKIIVKAEADNVNVPYGSWIGNKIVFASDIAEKDDIVVANDDGTNITPITANVKEGGLNIEPVFNPIDTTKILFEHVEYVNNAEHHHIKIFDTSRNRDFYLTNNLKYDDRLPSWSPDGKKILWQRYTDEFGWRIFTADIIVPELKSDMRSYLFEPEPKLENIKNISSGPDDTDNSWTWDGKHVLSSRTGDGEIPNIFALSLDGKATRITVSDKEDGAPSQSPDQKWIAFESHRGDENSPSEIWLIGSPMFLKTK